MNMYCSNRYQQLDVAGHLILSKVNDGAVYREKRGVNVEQLGIGTAVWVQATGVETDVRMSDVLIHLLEIETSEICHGIVYQMDSCFYFFFFCYFHHRCGHVCGDDDDACVFCPFCLSYVSSLSCHAYLVFYLQLLPLLERTSLVECSSV